MPETQGLLALETMLIAEAEQLKTYGKTIPRQNFTSKEISFHVEYVFFMASREGKQRYALSYTDDNDTDYIRL